MQPIIVEDTEENSRLDSFLVKHFPELSRAKIQRAIAGGQATVDDKVVKSSFRLTKDQQVEFSPPAPSPDGPIAEDIPLEILFEDESLVAINKPPGMVVHPAKGHWSGTLTAALAFHFESLSSIGGSARPGIVHRLDRDTSGLIIVAKTDKAHSKLAKQFEKRTIQKEYWALVSPAPERDRDIIDQPIGEHPYQREKKAIRHDHSSSREAQTFYEVVERFRGFAIVRLKPRTGRTHQIRVHMAHVRCPVICDRLYGGRARITEQDLTRREDDADKVILERQALHALKLTLKHPETGEQLELTAPLSQDLVHAKETIARLRPLE